MNRQRKTPGIIPIRGQICHLADILRHIAGRDPGLRRYVSRLPSALPTTCLAYAGRLHSVAVLV